MGLPNSNRAAAVGIDTQSKNFNEGAVYFLQQGVAIFAQGSSSVTYSTDKFEITSHQEVGNKLGYGSPAHLCAMQLLPNNGDGALGARITVYPLEQADTAVAATATITPTGTQTDSAEYAIRVGGIESNAFAVLKDETPEQFIEKAVIAINGVLEMPVVATGTTTVLTLTAKHTGVSGNQLIAEIIGDQYGIVNSITAFTGGLVDPEIDSATSQVGNIWETIIVNALGESAHDALSTFGEGRWGQLVKKPLLALYGSTETDVDVLKAYADQRKTDRVNGVIPAPDSVSAPWVIAARAIARIAKSANQNPAEEYRTENLDTVVKGRDGQQWDYPTRDTAWKSGVSSTQIENGQVVLDNTVLFYHPDGEPNPYYGKVVNLIKLQNIIYNLDILFNQESWRRAILIPDNGVSSNPSARKPSDAVAALYTLADNLANNALISDREFTKTNTTASIDQSNPNRVNTKFPVKLSGNWDIHSIDLLFGYYLGAS